MHRRIARPFVVALAPLLLVAALFSASADQPAAPPRLEFNEGIGYYWSSAGETHALGFPSIGDRFRQERNDKSPPTIYTLPRDARLFVYGIDFSKLEGPPHVVLGSAIAVYDSERAALVARWPAQFIPLRGYAEPVYEIVAPPAFMADLRAGKIAHSHFSLRVGDSDGLVAYLFRFAPADGE